MRGVRSTTLLRYFSSISLALGASILLACSGGESDPSVSPSQTEAAAPPGYATGQAEPATPPVPAALAPDDTNQADLREISADAQSCLDLVRSESYVAAVDPCQRAVANGASADVAEAYETAKTAVAETGTNAAVRAVASGLEGKSMVDSLKGSASEAIGEQTAPDSAADTVNALSGAAGSLEQP